MTYYDREKEIGVLVGKTISAIDVNNAQDEIRFSCADGSIYLMDHSQDCCENVSIEDINGDLDDLIGSPVTLAEAATNIDSNPPDANPSTIEYQDSFTWTFYRIATAKGFVTIRWYGSSNGYYSESVSFSEERGPADDANEQQGRERSE